MNLFYSIILSIIFYFILMVIVTNVIGMLIRGLFCRDTDSVDFIKTGKARPNPTLKISTGNIQDKIITTISLLATILILYLLNKYINVWATISALMLISSRIPDILWEIKKGEKVSTKNKPQGKFYFISNIMILISPLLWWWSIYSL